MPLAYYDAVCNWFANYGWTIKREVICTIQGTLSGIGKAIECFTNPGENVIIFTPVYGVFSMVIAGTGRGVTRCRLVYDEEGRTTIDYEVFEKLAVQKENTAVLFCNPQNPSGESGQKKRESVLAIIFQ